ncbi:MAG: hypothetical protein H6744_17920 [Deltaproteobacteria bacterium]|nr:hypothetical protein [Deltaproteobacteria bacterium]
MKVTTRRVLPAILCLFGLACDGGAAVQDADATPDAVADATGDATPDAVPDLVPAGPPALTSALTVIQVMRFVAEDPPGVSSGLDLDGLVTKAGDASGCGQPDLQSPDGRPGVDNAFAFVLPPLEATMSSTVNETAQEAIDTGEVLLLLAVDGIDDPVDDDQVTVSLYRAEGRPKLGTDGRVLAGQSFYIAEGEPWSRDETATIEGGVISAGPFPIVLSLDFFDTHIDLLMDNARVEYRLDADGRATGVLGAMSHEDTLYKMVTDLDADFLPIAEVLLPEYADIDMDGDGRCDALSIGVELTGASAHLYQDAVVPE